MRGSVGYVYSSSIVITVQSSCLPCMKLVTPQTVLSKPCLYIVSDLMHIS